jgi:ubiquinone/menaquinone biosynthesis C-methylase UbiE
VNGLDGLYRRRSAAYYDGSSPGLSGDVEFYVEEAQRAGGEVLEVGCGTGRMLLPIAEAGVSITGLDPAGEMLDIARGKVAEAPREVAERVTLLQGDVQSFSAEGQFRLAIIPYRAFLHLYTVEDQIAGLENLRRHLEPGGRLVFNVFDPRFEAFVARSSALGEVVSRLGEFTHPENGRRVVLYSSVQYDRESQMLIEHRTFEELDEEGRAVDRVHATLRLRYVFRYEMEHLLARCGFRVDALYGDFDRGPFVPGNEQVWIASRAD